MSIVFVRSAIGNCGINKSIGLNATNLDKLQMTGKCLCGAIEFKATEIPGMEQITLPKLLLSKAVYSSSKVTIICKNMSLQAVYELFVLFMALV